MELAEYEALLSDVELKLDRLKVLYEQWFQGMERLEPTIPRKDVDRRMVLARKEMPRNTALRFRFQQLVQRYTTLQTYWQRVGRQIEEGTYRRDLLKTRKQRLEARGLVASAKRGSYELDVDVDVDTEEVAASAAPRALSGAPLGPSVPPLAPVAPIPSAPVPPAGPRVLSPFARRGPATGGTASLPPASGPSVAPGPASPPTPAPARAPAPVSASAPAPAPVPASASAPTQAAGPATATFARPAGAASGPSTATFSRPKDAAPAARPAMQAPAPAPAPAPVHDAEERRVYERYIEARRKNNETTSVGYETVAKSLREMRERLKDRYAGKKVEFEVVVKDGKVGLKPVPK